MSRKRFPCRDKDGHDKRLGIVTFRLPQGLVRSRNFRPRQKTVVATGIYRVVSRRVFYAMTEFGQDKRVSCRDKVFCVATRCSQD